MHTVLPDPVGPPPRRPRRAARLLAVALCLTAPLAAAAQSSPSTRTGIVAAVWDGGGRSALPQFFLVERTGTATQLVIAPEVLAAAGGAQRIDRQEVTVEVAGGTPVGTALTVRSLRLAFAAAARTAEAPTRATGLAQPIGTLTAPPTPFITLLCRFADTPSDDLPRRSDVERMYASSYPAARHFFAEQAFGADVLAGSVVAQNWVGIKPRSAYIPSPETATTFATFAAADDCARASDSAGVRVSDFFGINFQFSGPLHIRSTPPFDPLSLGGTYVRSGPAAGGTQVFGATWLSSVHVRNYVVVEHEMGHALGWPHSEFVVGQEYDSRWDVMSYGYIGFEPSFGPVPSGTIAVNKQRRGWISDAATAAPAGGSVRTAVLRALALPWPGAADTSTYMARIAMAQSSCEYTVEARQRTGYDRFLPGSGVLIHQPCNLRPRLIGPTNARDGGAGAAWQPGSMMADSVGGVYVRVDSTTPAGYAVTLTRGWPLTVQVVAAGGTGTVTTGSVVCGQRCTVAAATRHQPLTATAVAGPGAMFLGWEGACSGVEPGCSVTMGGHREAAARFGAVVSIAARDAERTAVVGAAYADTLRAAGGTGKYRWSVTSGALPAGLILGDTSGIVSGTPTVAGSTQLVVAASSLTSTATATLAIRVVRATVVVSDSVRRDGVQGVAYADTLRFEGEAGAAAWSITGGALPAGLALDAATGHVGGTPTSAGIARFTATATAAERSGSRTFVLRVRRPTVVVSDSVRRPAIVGVAYADTLRAEAEPDESVTWAISGGALPSGLALDAASGVVSGTATAAVSVRFTATATAAGVSGARSFILRAVRTTMITSDSVRRRGVAGIAYADTLRANGDLSPGARWAVVGGALPAGIALDSIWGVLGGTPTVPSTARFVVEVAADGMTGRREFVLQVLRPTRIAGDSTRRAAVRGVAYADTLRADGEPVAVTWRVVGGALPAGLALDAASGVVSGVAVRGETARFTVRATSEVSADSRALTLLVVDGVQIASDSLRRGATVGEPYADTLRLTGGEIAARWSIVDGALPLGLTLGAESGLVTGTAERAGGYRYTAEATMGASDRRTFTIAVTAPTLAASDVLDQLLGAKTAALPPARMAYLDLIGNRNGRLDVGDVRAWLIDSGALPASSTLADVVPALARASGAGRGTRAASPPSLTPGKP